jgi:hypothetical protein
MEYLFLSQILTVEFVSHYGNQLYQIDGTNLFPSILPFIQNFMEKAHKNWKKLEFLSKN